MFYLLMRHQSYVKTFYNNFLNLSKDKREHCEHLHAVLKILASNNVLNNFMESMLLQINDAFKSYSI